MDGHGSKRRRKIAENFNWLSRVHERYRRQTDWHSERERSLKRRTLRRRLAVWLRSFGGAAARPCEISMILWGDQYSLLSFVSPFRHCYASRATR